MEIYHALKLDLCNHFRYHKRQIINRILHKQSPEPTYIQKYSERLFDIITPLIYDGFISLDPANQYCEKHFVNYWIYYNPKFKVDDFLKLIETDPRAKKRVERLNLCYKAFQECRFEYMTFGIKDFALKTNPRYVKLLRLTFERFKANRHCVEMDDSVSTIEKFIEVKK